MQTECRECGEAAEHYASVAQRCKACHQAAVTARRNANLEEHRAKDRARGNRQSREQVRARRARNPDKYKARTAVANALRAERLTKPSSCEDCGKRAKVHGHHEDYSKPLSVVWLCPPCHAQRHKLISA